MYVYLYINMNYVMYICKHIHTYACMYMYMHVTCF